MSLRAGYFCLVIFMLAFPVATLAHHLDSLENGHRVLIPVDTYSHSPSSDLNMVAFQTPLNRINPKTLAGENNFRKGEHIFVFLKPDSSGLWSPIALSRRSTHLPDDDASNSVMLRGTVKARDGEHVVITYNIEDQFVTAEQLTMLRSGPRPVIDVRISASGQARLKDWFKNANDARQSPMRVLDGGSKKKQSSAPAA